MGVWIRYTVHKPPGEEPKGSVWFTFFEAGAGGPIAAKTTVPDPVAGERDWIQVGEAAGMGDGRAYGWAGEAWWELSFEPYEAPLFHLPNSLMYRSKLPKTKLCSPAPFAVFGGRMGIGERQIPLDGWRGMVGHNWGSEHAERWIWLHAITDDGDWLDAAIGRVTMGSKTTPWIANGAVSIEGERFSLGGLGAGADVQGQARPLRVPPHHATARALRGRVGGARGLRGVGLRRPGRRRAPLDQLLRGRHARARGRQGAPGEGVRGSRRRRRTSWAFARPTTA